VALIVNGTAHGFVKFNTHEDAMIGILLLRRGKITLYDPRGVLWNVKGVWADEPDSQKKNNSKKLRNRTKQCLHTDVSNSDRADMTSTTLNSADAAERWRQEGVVSLTEAEPEPIPAAWAAAVAAWTGGRPYEGPVSELACSGQPREPAGLILIDDDE